MRLQLMHERLKESLRQYERELMQQRENERQLGNKNKLISTKLKAEKDEVGGAIRASSSCWVSCVTCLVRPLS